LIVSKEMVQNMILVDDTVIICGTSPIIVGHDIDSGKPREFIGHTGRVYALFAQDGYLYSGG
jgi:hypothetical protein